MSGKAIVLGFMILLALALIIWGIIDLLSGGNISNILFVVGIILIVVTLIIAKFFGESD